MLKKRSGWYPKARRENFAEVSHIGVCRRIMQKGKLPRSHDNHLERETYPPREEMVSITPSRIPISQCSFLTTLPFVDLILATTFL